VEIGFIDFQGLWEGWEKQFYRFSHAFHRPAFPPPVSAAADFMRPFSSEHASSRFRTRLDSHSSALSACVQDYNFVVLGSPPIATEISAVALRINLTICSASFAGSMY
jgi:hypothetical protein